MGKGNAYRLLMGKAKGKETTRRPRHRWVNNNKMGLEQIECVGGVLTGLLWLRIGTSGELL
jgi:hypothetical protein